MLEPPLIYPGLNHTLLLWDLACAVAAGVISLLVLLVLWRLLAHNRATVAVAQQALVRMADTDALAKSNMENVRIFLEHLERTQGIVQREQAHQTARRADAMQASLTELKTQLSENTTELRENTAITTKGAETSAAAAEASAEAAHVANNMNAKIAETHGVVIEKVAHLADLVTTAGAVPTAEVSLQRIDQHTAAIDAKLTRALDATGHET